MEQYIYENILSLSCPVGEFFVCFGKEKIPFSVRQNDYNFAYPVYDETRKSILYEFKLDTDYALDIKTSMLTIGQQYDVVFSEGGLHYYGADEHTEALTNTIGNWSVGIGDFDRNDDVADPRNYTGYEVWHAEDNCGFSFILLDRTVETITFRVAWIENKASNINYEDAISFFLT